MAEWPREHGQAAGDQERTATGDEDDDDDGDNDDGDHDYQWSRRWHYGNTIFS